MQFGSMNLINCISNSGKNSFNSALIPGTSLFHMNYLTQFLQPSYEVDYFLTPQVGVEMSQAQFRSLSNDTARQEVLELVLVTVVCPRQH